MMYEAPKLADNVQDNIVEQSKLAKKFIEIFKNDSTNASTRTNDRMKPTLVGKLTHNIKRELW